MNICVPLNHVLQLFMLPNVHKNVDNPPGRPIVSGIGTLSEPLSKFIDFLIKPYSPIICKHYLTSRQSECMPPNDFIITAYWMDT